MTNNSLIPIFFFIKITTVEIQWSKKDIIKNKCEHPKVAFNNCSAQPTKNEY